MTTTILLAFLAVATATALVSATHGRLARVRARRRAAWELDRIVWRNWINRP
jgi:hypothetical protein